MHSSDLWTCFGAAHIQWLGYRLSGFSGWEIVVYTLLTTHVTIIAVTVFLHWLQENRTLDFHPAVIYLYRTLFWLSTGIETRQWVAVQRETKAHRLELMAEYANRMRATNVVELRSLAVKADEAVRLSNSTCHAMPCHAMPWLHRDADEIPPHAKAHIALVLPVSPNLSGLI